MFKIVDPQGLEPRMSVPKTGVLPITPWVYVYFGGANLKNFFITNNYFAKIILKKELLSFQALFFKY